MASSVYDITFTICVTSHNACISDVIHSIFMTYPLYMASHKVLWPHNNCVTSQPLCLSSQQLYLCHHTQWINFIKSSVCMTSQPLCLWHHMQYMWHHMNNLGCHITLCMTSGPLYLTSIPMHLSHHINPIDDITASICMISHPVYLWHHFHYIYDISTKYDLTTLCSGRNTRHMYDILCTADATHPLYHTKPQYLWCHIHLSHENTTPVLDIACTVSMSSVRLHWHLTHFFMTSHPPLCDFIWTLYKITPNLYVITLLYLWHHIPYIWNHIQYEGKLYT